MTYLQSKIENETNSLQEKKTCGHIDRMSDEMVTWSVYWAKPINKRIEGSLGNMKLPKRNYK